MRLSELAGKYVVIWGKGREGMAAEAFIRRACPDALLAFVDEATDTKDAIKAALVHADVIVKSPGVSLYHPLVQSALDAGKAVTSLLNLWLAEPRTATLIGVTGTKGKSTTTSLLAHVLNALGKRAVIAGNIGVPVTEAPTNDAEIVVLEISSYQAANVDGLFDFGVLTSLYPEHLDWHRTLDAYYRDKMNLLSHSRTKIINAEALPTLRGLGLEAADFIAFDKPEAPIDNAYLARPGYASDVGAAVAVVKALGLDPAQALKALRDFKGLPHRQQELGERDGILYVDDSISTTPQSAIAALEAYAGRPLTLIAGGQDRGIDTAPLADYIVAHGVNAVVCMGASGQRLTELLNQHGYSNVETAHDMREAVALAVRRTPKGGAILLSPAAPSYDQFKNFEERGACFAKECEV